MLRLSILALFISSTAIASPYGADTVRCQTENGDEQTLHVDFVLTEGLGFEIAASDDPLERIKRLLEANTDWFSRYFNSYLLQLESDSTQHYYKWRERQLAAADPLAEDELALLPETCDPESVEEVIALDFRESSYWVNYDETNWPEIKRNKLQHSFALVHEFLWYYAHDRSIIRRANRFFHSTAIEGPLDLGPLGFEQYLYDEFGLNVGFQSQYVESHVSLEEELDGSIKFDQPYVEYLRPNPSVMNDIVITNNTSKSIMFGDTFHDGDWEVIEPGATYTQGGYFIRGGWMSAVVYDRDNWPPEEGDRIYLPVREL